MADFVLKKKKAFLFQIEGNRTTYSIPAVSKLPIADVEDFQKIQQVDLAEQMEIAKEFVLKYNPELEEADIGASEYLEIFGAYAKSQNNAGES